MDDAVGTKETGAKVRHAVIGHARAIDLLARALDQGRLAHAYLFVGPSQVGKATVARTFIGALLGDDARLDRHPDFTCVERGDDPKTGKARSGIVLDQVRHLCTRLSMGALMNGWKAAIIDDAHLMNTESANALLKSLEEPHKRTLLVLLAPSAEAVMPTIRSRCQIIRFARVPSTTITEALIERGVVENEATLYARLSDGRPGRAFGYADDPDTFKDMETLRDALFGLLDAPLADRVMAVEKLLPTKMPFVEAGARAHVILDLASELLRDALLCTLGDDAAIVHVDVSMRISALAERLGMERMAAALEAVERARVRIRENVNPRAALEHLALSL